MRGRTLLLVAVVVVVLVTQLSDLVHESPGSHEGSRAPPAVTTARLSSDNSREQPPPNAGRGTKDEVTTKDEETEIASPQDLEPVSSTSPTISSPLADPTRRAVIPLLLTHIRYHGTSLLATTIKGWIKQFLVPQGNVDLVIVYVSLSDRDEIIKLLRLKPTTPDPTVVQLKQVVDPPIELFDPADHIPLRNVTSNPLTAEGPVTAAESIGTAEVEAEPEWFVTPHDDKFKLRLLYTHLGYPKYIRDRPEHLQNNSWMRCGCPPYCPVRRATVEYVQGTRWYTYDLMKLKFIRSYHYWIKLDVDIWFYRPMTYNLVERMDKEKKVFGHTGKKFNGAGCSAELHPALLRYAKVHGMPIVSRNETWWIDDDDTYYSNFVISSLPFHTSKPYLQVAKYLNDFPNGFFRYRWTDQSLFHKVFGLFFGPKESAFALDLSELRCLKKGRSPKAVFWHSKREKKRADLKKCL